jgi:hypothetical protein
VFQLEGGIMPNKLKEENIESNSWKELCFRPQTGERVPTISFPQCHQCGKTILTITIVKTKVTIYYSFNVMIVKLRWKLLFIDNGKYSHVVGDQVRNASWCEKRT